MEDNTTAQEVYDSFESIFSDKKEIADALEFQWLKMSIARYNTEIAVETTDKLVFDELYLEFNKKLDDYVILTLGQMIRELYQEREYSRVNKIVSIVGKDLSVNSGMSLSKNSKEELDYHKNKTDSMIDNQKPTALL